MSEPSIGEANKVIRVLNGVRLKYTIHLHLSDKKVVEFQAEKLPEVKWHDQARALWLFGGGYPEPAIMPWPEGAIMLCEENPKV